MTKPSSTPAMDALDLNHQRFVNALFLSPSAAAAYTKVYETKGAAAESGASRLLRSPGIQAALAEKRATIALRTEISVSRVVQEYARIGFSSMRTFVSWGPTGLVLIDDEELSEDDARCVAEVSETKPGEKGGGSIKIKLHDKKAALDKLVELLGITPEMVRKLYPGFDALGLDDQTRQTRVLTLLRDAKERKAAATNG